MDTIIKFLPNAVTKSKVEDQYDFSGSTEDPDRDGDVIRLDGWDTAQFEVNPVVFYGHDYRGSNVKFPIGTATVTKDTVNRRLLFNVKFTASHEDAQTVKALVDEGVLRACSVGFIAKEGGVNLMVNPENGTVVGREFNGQTLLELSIVPLPANPNAIRLALEKGLCTEANAKAWGLLPEPDAEARVQRLEAEVKALSEKLALVELGVKHAQGQVVKVPTVEAGGESSTDPEQKAAFYAELLTLGRSLADYLHPAESAEAKLARETADLFKQAV